MPVANIPEITPVQQVSASPLSTSEGGSSGESLFSSLVNQELNNTEINTAPETADSAAKPVQPGLEMETAGDILFSMMENAFTIHMPEATDGPASERVSTAGAEESQGVSEELLKTETSGENGMKTGILLHEIFRVFQVSNQEGLPGGLTNETEGNEAAEKAIIGLRNALGERAHLINEQVVKDDGDESSDGTAGLLKPVLSGESGLKIGALLYEMINAYLEQNQDGSQTAPAVPCSDENSDVCQARINMPSEHGLKLGIPAAGSDSGKQQTESGINDSKNFLDALTRTVTDIKDADTNQLNLLKERAEHTDGKNTNQVKATQTQMNTTNPDAAENREILNGPQNIMLAERAKVTGNADLSGNFQNNPAKNANTETASDGFHSLNHSNIALENSRPGDGTVAGHVARPSGFNQVLDNIVYVAKGNTKLGVSVEHSTLGKLDINLSMEKGILNVHINTSERAAREFIENNIQHIVNSLSKEGVNVGGLSVALKNRRDREDNIFTANNGNGNEKEPVQAVEKIRTMSGAVNIFA